MKASVRLQKDGRKRTITLRGNSLLIVFHNNIESEDAYVRLKNEMKKSGWGTVVSKHTPEGLSSARVGK